MISRYRAALAGLILSIALSLLLPLGGEAAAQQDAYPATSEWNLKVHDGRLSVIADRVPLGRVLRELARQTPVTVSLKGPVASQPVAVRFENLSMEEGIKKILQGHEYALIRARRMQEDVPGPDGIETVSIREILVLSRPGTHTGDAGEWAEISGVEPRSFKELRRQAAEAENPGDRAVALEELVMEGEDEELIIASLTKSLKDSDSGVRELALDLLEDTLLDIPPDPIARIALRDRNPRLRAKALGLLTFRAEGAASTTLESALQDPDIRVRQVAAELLDELELLSTPDEPDEGTSAKQ